MFYAKKIFLFGLIAFCWGSLSQMVMAPQAKAVASGYGLEFVTKIENAYLWHATNVGNRIYVGSYVVQEGDVQKGEDTETKQKYYQAEYPYDNFSSSSLSSTGNHESCRPHVLNGKLFVITERGSIFDNGSETEIEDSHYLLGATSFAGKNLFAHSKDAGQDNNATEGTRLYDENGNQWKSFHKADIKTYGMTVFNNELYLFGQNEEADYKSMHNAGKIAKVDTNGTATSLSISAPGCYQGIEYKGNLYAGCGSRDSGTAGIYKLENGTFVKSGSFGVSNFGSMAVYDNKLFAAGVGSNGGGPQVIYFDGSSWKTAFSENDFQSLQSDAGSNSGLNQPSGWLVAVSDNLYLFNNSKKAGKYGPSYLFKISANGEPVEPPNPPPSNECECGSTIVFGPGCKSDETCADDCHCSKKPASCELSFNPTSMESSDTTVTQSTLTWEVDNSVTETVTFECHGPTELSLRAPGDLEGSTGILFEPKADGTETCTFHPYGFDGTAGADCTASVVVSAPEEKDCTLNFDPASIELGGETKFSWDVTGNITYAYLACDQAGGGEITEYIQANRSGNMPNWKPTVAGTETCHLYLNGLTTPVCDSNPLTIIEPPRCTLNFDPASIELGGETKFSWDVTGNITYAYLACDQAGGGEITEYIQANRSGNMPNWKPTVAGTETCHLYLNGLTTPVCDSNPLTIIEPSQNLLCGSLDQTIVPYGTNFSSYLDSELCPTGKTLLYKYDGDWCGMYLWSCTGSTTGAYDCKAFTEGRCGTVSGTTVTSGTLSKDSPNLCAGDTPSNFTNTGTAYTWKCGKDGCDSRSEDNGVASCSAMISGSIVEPYLRCSFDPEEVDLGEETTLKWEATGIASLEGYCEGLADTEVVNIPNFIGELPDIFFNKAGYEYCYFNGYNSSHIKEASCKATLQVGIQSVCGNGTLEEGEECDDTSPFSGGQLHYCPTGQKCDSECQCVACTADCSCETSTCVGSTCSDGCGGMCAGKKTDGVCVNCSTWSLALGATPTSGQVPLTVNLIASTQQTMGGENYLYSDHSCGTGGPAATNANGKNFTCVYLSAGTYQPSIKVTAESTGCVKNASASVTVNAASYSCTGSVPTGSTMCTNDSTGLTATLPWQSVGTSASSCTETRKCEYYTPSSYSCTGTEFIEEGTICPNDNTGLTATLPWKTVGFYATGCTDERKCEYWAPSSVACGSQFGKVLDYGATLNANSPNLCRDGVGSAQSFQKSCGAYIWTCPNILSDWCRSYTQGKCGSVSGTTVVNGSLTKDSANLCAGDKPSYFTNTGIAYTWKCGKDGCEDGGLGTDGMVSCSAEISNACDLTASLTALPATGSAPLKTDLTVSAQSTSEPIQCSNQDCNGGTISSIDTVNGCKFTCTYNTNGTYTPKVHVTNPNCSKDPTASVIVTGGSPTCAAETCIGNSCWDGTKYIPGTKTQDCAYGSATADPATLTTPNTSYIKWNSSGASKMDFACAGPINAARGGWYLNDAACKSSGAVRECTDKGYGMAFGASQVGTEICVFYPYNSSDGQLGTPFTVMITSNKGIIDGKCGTADRTYAYTETSWGNYTLCSAGTADPTSPTFPATGGSTTWKCKGVNGGTDSGECQAKKADTPLPGDDDWSVSISADPTLGNPPLKVELDASWSKSVDFQMTVEVIDQSCGADNVLPKNNKSLEKLDNYFECEYPTVGTYKPSITYEDNAGNKKTATTTVSVTNEVVEDDCQWSAYWKMNPAKETYAIGETIQASLYLYSGLSASQFSLSNRSCGSSAVSPRIIDDRSFSCTYPESGVFRISATVQRENGCAKDIQANSVYVGSNARTCKPDDSNCAARTCKERYCWNGCELIKGTSNDCD